MPDLVVHENIPADLKGRDESMGEASLQGHLKNGNEDMSTSQAYVPADPKKDNQLILAVDWLHGKKVKTN